VKTQPCPCCDGYGVVPYSPAKVTYLNRGLALDGFTHCTECDGTGDIPCLCITCSAPLADDEDEYCRGCLDKEYGLSCEWCPAAGGGCCVCLPSLVLPVAEVIC
jgi:hypothetical protein